MFLVEHCLGVGDAAPERLVPAPSQPSSAKLTFYFDYASPWSYLASLRMEELLRSVAPVSVCVEWVPLLVGALFKKIGTPVVSNNDY
jgi:2-hydroxychromene-2-carboxylate isomerase